VGFLFIFLEDGKMKKAGILAILVCLLVTANFALADTIRGINIDFVTIGNPGNAVDTQVMNDGTTGYGTVGYNYRIGKYEVTNAQWNAFTAVAGAPTGNPYYAYDQSAYFGGSQQPTTYVSWYETLQFCNYLTSGDKSKGVYQFSGNNANPGDFLGMSRASAQAIYGTIYVLPNENEWYKAAYYKPNGSGYSLYANGTNTAPISAVDSLYAQGHSQPWNVGMGTQEQNGSFDMMGNIAEWIDPIVSSTGLILGVRGGSCYYGDLFDLSSPARGYYIGFVPDYEYDLIGFRVAEVPEPCTLLLFGLGGLLLRREHRYCNT
jgi:sulfatase modifying factor 1